MARHHGLPVRLLDWTSNALVALYFAAGHEKRDDAVDAAVWAFIGTSPFHHVDMLREDEGDSNLDYYYQSEDELTDQLIKDDFVKHKKTICFNELQLPLRLKGIRLLYPFDVSARIVAQGCAFTIQQNPWEDLQEYDPREKGIGTEYVDIKRIIKWKVPGDARQRIIKELQRSNIDYRTLFPDLDGLAKGLWHLEILRKAKTVS